MGNKQAMINECIRICNDNSVGYSQVRRWLNPDVDCSSLMYICAKSGGYTSRWGSGYTGTMLNDFKAAGFTAIPFSSLSQVQPGDILLNTAYHTEMCVAPGRFAGAHYDEKGGIAGETGGDQTGKEVSVGNAYVYKRGWNWILRAPSDGSTVPSPSNPSVLTVDGIWSKETTRALQKWLGTTQDGIISGQDKTDYSSVNRGGLDLSTWTIGRGGSDVIRALQKLIGANADGYFGAKTCKSLQKYLGTTQDGYVSKPSDMVKAMQRNLNAGTF